MHSKTRLERFSNRFSKWTGTTNAFIAAFSIIVIGLSVGYFFDFSNTWQTALNSFISILTFLMLFIMQRSENKESQALQLKLNELLAAQGSHAGSKLIDIENAPEAEIEVVQKQHSKKKRA